MSLKKRLETARNEKDVENIYREELNTHTEGAQITSPYGIDGLLEANFIVRNDIGELLKKINVRSLLEFKYDEQLKLKLYQCSLLIQCLYYLKKFEDNGQKFILLIEEDNILLLNEYHQGHELDFFSLEGLISSISLLEKVKKIVEQHGRI